MSERNIKIKGVADFSAIAKEVQGLQNTIANAFGKDGIKVLDDKSVSLLKKEVGGAIEKVKQQLGKLKKEAKELDEILKSTSGNEKGQEEVNKKRLENIRKTVIAEKELKNLQRSSETVEAGKVIPLNKRGSFGGMAGGQIANGIKGAAGELPGIAGPAMSVAGNVASAGEAAAGAGLGIGAIAGVGLLAAAAGAAAVSVSRMVAGFETFIAELPKLNKMWGMGVTPANWGTINKAGKLGYDVTDVLATQIGANKAFGKGNRPQADQNRTLNILSAARATGLESGEITSAGNQLRQAGGAEMAQKQIGMILEKAVTSGMDKTQTSAYLSSAVTLLSDINQSGLGNVTDVLDAFTNVVAKNRMSPEQAAKTFAGINSAISGSSGEANAYFQSAAVSSGLGGGSILGTQFAVRQGLLGTNTRALEKETKGTNAGKEGVALINQLGLGDENFTKKMAGGILEQANRFKDSQAKFGFVGGMFGTKTVAETTRVLSVLERLSNNTASAKDKTYLSNLTKNPEDAWRDKTLGFLGTIAGSTAASQAALKNGKFELGQASAPYFNKLTDALVMLDGTIRRVIGGEDESQGVIKKSVGGMGAGDMGFPGIASSISDFFTGGKPKSESKPDALPSAAHKVTDSAEHLNELKNINNTLKNAFNRPGVAPRAGRDSSRK